MFRHTGNTIKRIKTQKVYAGKPTKALKLYIVLLTFWKYKVWKIKLTTTCLDVKAILYAAYSVQFMTWGAGT